jgi:peptidoglycan/LPS O-acetylase OafA/YrhL
MTAAAPTRPAVGPRLASQAPTQPDPTGHVERIQPPRWVELDVWRVLAAFSIPLFHIWQTMHTAGNAEPEEHNPVWMGIMRFIQTAPDAFFLISAMVLVPPMVRNAIEGRARNDYGAFVRRRFMRVVPLYWFLIIVVWSCRNFSFRTGQLPDLLLHMVFGQQFSSRDIFYDNGPAWSLSLECMFYLAIPIWIGGTTWLIRRVRDRRARIAALCVGPVITAGLSEGWKQLGVMRHVPATRWAWWFDYPSRADVFALGSLIAIWLALRGERSASVSATVLMRLGGVAVLLTLPWVYHHDPVWYYSVGGLGFAPILAASVGGQRLITPHLDGPGLARLSSLFVWLSGFTFSVFLGQEPIIVLLHNVGLTPADPRRLFSNEAIAMVCVIVFSYLLWVFVEGPTYRLRWLPLARSQRTTIDLSTL